MVNPLGDGLVQLDAEGMTTRAIGEELGISAASVVQDRAGQQELILWQAHLGRGGNPRSQSLCVPSLVAQTHIIIYGVTVYCFRSGTTTGPCRVYYRDGPNWIFTHRPTKLARFFFDEPGALPQPLS